MASSNAANAATDIAVSAIRRAVRLSPRSAVVWTARGEILELVEPRDYSHAVTAYRKAIELSPWDADAHRLLGQALLEMGSTDGAIEQFHLALSADRGDPATLVAVGVLHMRARRYHDACRALNAAVANEPRFAEAYAERALARLHLKDIRSAYGDAETAVRLGAWLTGTVAQVLADVDARDSAGAKTRIAALVATESREVAHPSVWAGHYLAEWYAALGKDDRALELLSHAAPRGASLWLALQDPAFDRLHGESRYTSLIDDSRPVSGP
jgi:tetratricopeptide (TPR) repeat protein